jgi:quinol monooxygenase YgiN
MPVLQAVAIHHPHPEHTDAFLSFMHRVVQAVEGAQGLIEFSTWRDTSSGRLVAVSRWESPESFADVMPLIMSLSPERQPEWSAGPDELVTMVEA